MSTTEVVSSGDNFKNERTIQPYMCDHN
jgi:hypothetical protein